MFEPIIWTLIIICVVCLVVVLAFWVIESVVEIQIPPKAKKIIWIIVLLVCLLLLLRVVIPIVRI